MSGCCQCWLFPVGDLGEVFGPFLVGCSEGDWT